MVLALNKGNRMMRLNSNFLVEDVMKKQILTAICALSISGLAVGGDVYKSLDLDSNGVISHSEAAALPELSDRWKELDADANGELTVEEFARFEIVDIPVPAKQDPKALAPVMDATESK